MTALWQSFLLVLASEMGDKTQLLAIVLAARFRRPWVVMGGILVATLINHGLASWAGGWLSTTVSPEHLRWILAATFLGFAVWILIPDKDDGLQDSSRYGAFVTTVITFFLAEMGDKTQLATVALGARFANPWTVTAGTTLGMLVADGLVVCFGEQLTKRIPMAWIRRAACLLFALFGVLILFAL